MLLSEQKGMKQKEKSFEFQNDQPSSKKGGNKFFKKGKNEVKNAYLRNKEIETQRGTRRAKRRKVK